MGKGEEARQEDDQVRNKDRDKKALVMEFIDFSHAILSSSKSVNRFKLQDEVLSSY